MVVRSLLALMAFGCSAVVALAQDGLPGDITTPRKLLGVAEGIVKEDAPGCFSDNKYNGAEELVQAAGAGVVAAYATGPIGVVASAVVSKWIHDSMTPGRASCASECLVYSASVQNPKAFVCIAEAGYPYVAGAPKDVGCWPAVRPNLDPPAYAGVYALSHKNAGPNNVVCATAANWSHNRQRQMWILVRPNG